MRGIAGPLVLALLTCPLPAPAADIFWAPPIGDLLTQPFPGEDFEEYRLEAQPPRAIFADAPHLRIEGPITPGDGERLRALLQEKLPNPNEDMFNNVVISLNSDGGDFYEGLKLSDTIAKFAVATYVGAGDRCLSSCALAFLGGRTVFLRGLAPVPARFVHAGAVLGFHSPFSDLPAAIQIPDGTPLTQDLGGQMALQFYGQAQSAINEIARRMEAWNLAPDFVFRMLGKGTLPGDTREVNERFVLVNSFRALSETSTKLLSPNALTPKDIGIVDAENACNLVFALNLDQFQPLFRAGPGYASFISPDVIGEGDFIDRDANGQTAIGPIRTTGGPLPGIEETEIVAGSKTRRLLPAAGRDSFFFSGVVSGLGPSECNVYRDGSGGWVVQSHNPNIHYGANYSLRNGAVDGSETVVDFAAPLPLNSYLFLGVDGVWNNFPPLRPEERHEPLLARFPDLKVPSFDCGGALDPAAGMICGVRVLATLDGLMGHLYTEALATDGDGIRDQQRLWVAARDKLCRAGSIDPGDTLQLRNLIECLRRLYTERVDGLADLTRQ